jgi:hypothetical protein
MTMEEPDRSFFLALLDKIYPGPREAVERAWGNPELAFRHFYRGEDGYGIISLLRANRTPVSRWGTWLSSPTLPRLSWSGCAQY